MCMRKLLGVHRVFSKRNLLYLIDSVLSFSERMLSFSIFEEIMKWKKSEIRVVRKIYFFGILFISKILRRSKIKTDRIDVKLIIMLTFLEKKLSNLFFQLM